MRVTWDPFHPQFCFQIALEGLVRLSPGLRDLPLATWPLGLGRTGAHFSVPCIRGFSALEADKESSKCICILPFQIPQIPPQKIQLLPDREGGELRRERPHRAAHNQLLGWVEIHTGRKPPLNHPTAKISMADSKGA
jgi:hypothetical protein